VGGGRVGRDLKIFLGGGGGGWERPLTASVSLSDVLAKIRKKSDVLAKIRKRYLQNYNQNCYSLGRASLHKVQK